LHRKLTLISAPAGFGKTTLVSEWVAGCERSAAWLSLDQGDNDPTRFLIYIVAALRTIEANIGKGVLGMLQSPQPPTAESILTALLNEIASVPRDLVLVLDDYHVIDSEPIDFALTYLIEHLPPQMRLVIATREDPDLALARLRASDQLTELRVTDLRFDPSEAAEFLNQVMDLTLSTADIAALETRTEGWIAGLQLAAISLQGQKDVTGFIKSFTGSHSFVMDYLVEEVLQQQPESIQTFLLRTSILDRMCGPLCDAVLLDPSASGQETLEYLEQANLFIVPLDNERRWYRYHHLFSDLLRQRLHQSDASSTPASGNDTMGVNELHIRASEWYDDNGLEIDAFHHATAAKDYDRAERLIEGKGMPLHFRGAVAPVLNWLASLPTTVLDSRPSLWTSYASVLLVTGHTTGAEPKLRAAEAALKNAEPNEKNRDLIGRIAAIRATAATSHNQIETIIAESRRALDYLHPNNLAFRTSTACKLGYAYHLQGNRAAAKKAYTEVVSIGQASGNTIFTLLATIGLGSLQEAENKLYAAAQTFQRVLEELGDPPLPFASEAQLGLGRICYEWNDLDAAKQHAQQSGQLARQIEHNDRIVTCEVFLARLKLAQGDADGAAAILSEAAQFVRQNNFSHRMPEVAAAQVITLLRQNKLGAASNLAQTYPLPVSLARVSLANGDSAAALAALEPYRREIEARGWEDERLKVMVLQAVALHAHGEKNKAMQFLSETLALAEPGGFIRIFIDEGSPMADLLSEAAVQGVMPEYVTRLLGVFEAEKHARVSRSHRAHSPQPLIDPLSQRELEVLQLIADGLSNREIGERLFLAEITVKGHNQRIFGKLQVQRRTEAVARARELGLL
jgi:LuxR family maltose regulon positive regulatory protein